MSTWTTWTTMDGRVLEIRWMHSQHLVNTVNFVLQRNNLSRAQLEAPAMTVPALIALRDEVKARQLYCWAPGNQLVKLDVPKEDFKTLCMLRAIIDTQPKGVHDIIELFHRNPVSYSEHVLTCADPKWIPVVTKFAEYRLTPPAQWR